MRIITADDSIISLGTLETKPTISIVDYSRRVTDDFGVTTVVPRGFARRMSLRIALPSDDVDRVQQTFAALRATPVRWEADSRFAWLNFTGFYKDFEMDLAVPPLSYCTLTVEGLGTEEPAAVTGGDPAPAGSVSSLCVINPIPITPAMLLATNVPEIDYSTWSAGTTYAQGARVISTVTHRIYESSAAANVGNDPATSSLWIDIGPTNRWAMFDQALGTVTDRNESIVVTIDAGPISAIALLDVTGDTVRVQASGYDRTAAVADGAITFLDLPEGTEEVTVTIASTGSAAVGTLMLGQYLALGVTGDAPTSGIMDFSKKEVDDFGEVTVVPRAFAKRMNTRALLRTDALDVVADRITKVRAKPALWIANDGIDALTIYGYFKDFSIEVDEAVSILSLSVEGLSEAPPLPAGLPATNWPDVGDPDPSRPKPQDGATVGAVVGDNLLDGDGNPLTAEDVVTSEGTAARVAMIGDFTEEEFAQKVTDAESEIADLISTYGDTASAAASRLAAEAAEDAAELARAQAQTAASNADDSASAAAGEASIAATSASSAEISAVAAQASATTANTKAGEASVSASNAAGSASTAAGHSSSASSNASAAATSKNAAAGSASAAATAASSAGTLASDAALSAAAAQSNRLTAEVAASNAQYLDVAHAFNFQANNLNGFVPSGCTIAGQGDGALLVPTSTDPYLQRTGLSFSGARFTRVIIEVTRLTARPAGGSHDGRVYWSTASHGWSGSYNIFNGEIPQLGVRTTLTFDIPSSPTVTGASDWLENTVTGIRFDLDHTTSSQWKIHSLRIVGPDGKAPATAATIATDQAVIATNAAAAASSTVALAASLNSGYLNPNAGFDDYPSATVGAYPVGWANWIGVGHYRVSDDNGGYAVRIPAGAGANAGIRHLSTQQLIMPNEYYVLECEIKLNSGTLVGSALYANLTNAAGSFLSSVSIRLWQDPSQTGEVVGNGVVGRLYRFSKLVRATHADTRRFDLFAMSHFDSVGSIAAANDITWYKAAIRPATINEIAAGVTLPALEATVVVQQSALATLNDRAATYLVRVSSGVGTAEVRMAALDSGGAAASSVGFRADRITLGTMTSPVLSIVSGRATVTADLYVQNGRIVIETDTHMKVQGNGFGTTGQFIDWFGPRMAISACSEANGITYIKKNGDAYFGGTLSAGIRRNSNQATALTSPLQTIVGPFATAGNPITVVASYTYQTQTEYNYTPTQGAAFSSLGASYGATGSGPVLEGSTTATAASSSVVLARKIGAGAFTDVQSASTTTEVRSFYGTRPNPAEEVNGWAITTHRITITFTYTDTAGGIANREFRAIATRGFTYPSGSITQNLTVITTEN